MSIQSAEISPANSFRIVLIGLVGTLIALAAFGGALLQLVGRWASQEEYSHGFLVPLVTIGLLWMRGDALRASVGRPSWAGPILLVVATVMHIVGEIGAIPKLSHIGFIVALMGLVLGLGGYRLLQVAIFPILFLLFAIPIPHFIDFAISLQLQLVSSQLGAFFIRLFGIPVYLDGNVIDLGYYKIQIVEACSGLRYIYPLLSLGLLAAYFFRGPLWQRAVVVFSVVPLAIVMNSARIGLVGITVNYWGIQAAEGILHLFEGWFVFLICACMVALLIYVLARVSDKSFSDVFSLPVIPTKLRCPTVETRIQGPLGASLLILCLAAGVALSISSRSEIIPDRPRFVSFPQRIGPWQGHASLLEADIERSLHPDDYLLSDYKVSDGNVVNVYVAYYASQRANNNKPHSPGECMPATGWNITSFRRITNIDKEIDWPLNRVVIQKGGTKQLVYYWFNERGRKVANEHLVRWYLHADAVVRNRTDGALVRLVTQIQGDSEHEADQRLQAFIRDAMPTLSEYLPSEVVPRAKSVRFKSMGAQS